MPAERPVVISDVQWERNLDRAEWQALARLLCVLPEPQESDDEPLQESA